ncbi:MAG TPA: tRNA (adenosine(37)-N6)-threonylcarbamoyltransferase complex ATPase subunit type 1 TsaE [Candidatus Saccharimonadia bacterium]|nr:tRNA (adenosine(37)-N6)-threonylcarbamoyltransferase complex ATPase subunit type 1 TsaE [Candidatus Saccharimonadia bacterium]
MQGGEVIELSSDLGGGKTTFVQGLAHSLGYHGEVTSPTFTLSQIYPLKSGLELHHYDLYRLQSSGIVGREVTENMGALGVVTIIEWAGVLGKELPTDRLRIELEVVGETSRRLVFEAAGPISRRLLQGLQG